MISGSRGSNVRTSAHREARRRLTALLAAAVFGLPAPWLAAQTAPAFDLSSLLSMIARIGPSNATFHERKFLRELDAPVDSSGELHFDPPATLELRTLQPRIETMRVDGQTLTLSRGRLQRTLQLAEHPEIAIYVEPIRAALAGDRTALERGFLTELSGEPANWKLRLTPKTSAAAAPAQVESLQLSGRDAQVRQVEVRLADGDYSVMNIEPAAPPR